MYYIRQLLYYIRLQMHASPPYDDSAGSALHGPCRYYLKDKLLQVVVDMQDMRNGVVGFTERAKGEMWL